MGGDSFGRDFNGVVDWVLAQPGDLRISVSESFLEFPEINELDLLPVFFY